MSEYYVNKVIINQEPIIDLTNDDVKRGDVKSGVKFHLPSGEPTTGTLAEPEAPEIVLEKLQQAYINLFTSRILSDYSYNTEVKPIHIYLPSKTMLGKECPIDYSIGSWMFPYETSIKQYLPTPQYSGHSFMWEAAVCIEHRPNDVKFTHSDNCLPYPINKDYYCSNFFIHALDDDDSTTIENFYKDINLCPSSSFLEALDEYTTSSTEHYLWAEQWDSRLEDGVGKWPAISVLGTMKDMDKEKPTFTMFYDKDNIFDLGAVVYRAQEAQGIDNDLVHIPYGALLSLTHARQIKIPSTVESLPEAFLSGRNLCFSNVITSNINIEIDENQLRYSDLIVDTVYLESSYPPNIPYGRCKDYFSGGGKMFEQGTFSYYSSNSLRDDGGMIFSIVVPDQYVLERYFNPDYGWGGKLPDGASTQSEQFYTGNLTMDFMGYWPYLLTQTEYYNLFDSGKLPRVLALEVYDTFQDKVLGQYFIREGMSLYEWKERGTPGADHFFFDGVNYTTYYIDSTGKSRLLFVDYDCSRNVYSTEWGWDYPISDGSSTARPFNASDAPRIRFYTQPLI